MKAIDTRILVQVDQTACIQKIGALELSADAADYEVAKVLSVGGKIKSENELNEGDSVMIYKNSGKEFTRDGQRYRVISVNEIIVVL